MIASILVINKFNRYKAKNLAEANCNSADTLINKYMDCYIRIFKATKIMIRHDRLVHYHACLT